MLNIEPMRYFKMYFDKCGRRNDFYISRKFETMNECVYFAHFVRILFLRSSTS